MMPPLVKPEAALIQRRTLCAPDRDGIPVAARKEDCAVFLHGIYQDKIPSTVQLHGKDCVATQRLTYGARGTVDESTLLIKVASQSHLDTWSGKYPKGRLGRWIAEIPTCQILFVDPRDSQGGPAYLSGPRIRAGQP